MIQSTCKGFLKKETNEIKLLEIKSQDINLLASRISSDSLKDQLNEILEMKNRLEVQSNSTNSSNKKKQEKSELQEIDAFSEESMDEKSESEEKAKSFEGKAVKDYEIDIKSFKNFFQDREVMANSGYQLTPYMFKETQIYEFFPGGVLFLNPRDNKKSIKSKIDEILLSDSQVAVYIDVAGNDLNCII